MPHENVACALIWPSVTCLQFAGEEVGDAVDIFRLDLKGMTGCDVLLAWLGRPRRAVLRSCTSRRRWGAG